MMNRYDAEINEGIFNRTKARLSGAKAGLTQPFKNMYKVGGSVFKGTGPKGISLTGMDEASIEAKIKSIAKSSAKDLLNDWHKLGLISDLRDEDIETLKNAFIETLKEKGNFYKNKKQAQGQQAQGQQAQKQQYSDEELSAAKIKKQNFERTLKDLSDNIIEKLNKIEDAKLKQADGKIGYFAQYKNEKGEEVVNKEVQNYINLLNQTIKNTLKNYKNYSPAFWNLVSQREGMVYFPSLQFSGQSFVPVTRYLRFDMEKKNWVNGTISNQGSDKLKDGSNVDEDKKLQRYWQKKLSEIKDLESFNKFLDKMRQDNVRFPDINSPVQFKNQFFDGAPKGAMLYFYADSEKGVRIGIKNKSSEAGHKYIDRDWDQENIKELINSTSKKLDEYIVQNKNSNITGKDLIAVLEKLPNIEDIKKVANNLNNSIPFNNNSYSMYWNEENKQWAIVEGIQQEPFAQDYVEDEDENEQNASSTKAPAAPATAPAAKKTRTPAKPKTPEDYAKIGSRILSDRNNVRKLEGMEDLSSKMLKYASSRKPLKKKRGVTTMVNYADKIGSDIDGLLKKFGVKV